MSNQLATGSIIMQYFVQECKKWLSQARLQILTKIIAR